MKLKLIIPAVILAASCQSIDSNHPTALQEVATSLHEGEAVLGALTLQATSCQILEGRLYLEEVRVAEEGPVRTLALGAVH